MSNASARAITSLSKTDLVERLHLYDTQRTG